MHAVLALDAGAVRPQPQPHPTLVLCPYCGSESTSATRCDRCRGLMDPLSRQASQNAMGPWFIRDEAAPFRPGCSYDTLRALIAKGKITLETLIRGPSTRQFWTRAAGVPGVAHLLGECHACHTTVSADFAACPTCAAPFECETDRQHLGLAPVRLLPGHATPEAIARSMIESLRASPDPARLDAPVSEPATAPAAPAPPLIPDPVASRPRHARRMLLVVAGLLVLLAAAALTAWLVVPDEVSALLSRWFG